MQKPKKSAADPSIRSLGYIPSEPSDGGWLAVFILFCFGCLLYGFMNGCLKSMAGN